MRLAIIFTILIIGGAYIDNCQKQNDLAGRLGENVLWHEQRGILPALNQTEGQRDSTSTREIRQLDSKRNSRRVHIGSNNRNGRMVTFVVTAYTANDKGMNGLGITASGRKARPYHTIAASRGYRFGQRIYFPSINRTLTVDDRGGSVQGNHIDYYVKTKQEAKEWGIRKLKGVVLD